MMKKTLMFLFIQSLREKLELFSCREKGSKYLFDEISN